MDDVLSNDLPKLMKLFPQGNPSLPEHMRNPFAEFVSDDGTPMLTPQENPFTWEAVERSRYRMEFEQMNPVDGKLSGAVVKPVLIETGLPVADLGSIWSLSDLTKDGYLDLNEYSLCMHFIKLRNAGVDLPKKLPPEMLPPKDKVQI